MAMSVEEANDASHHLGVILSERGAFSLKLQSAVALKTAGAMKQGLYACAVLEWSSKSLQKHANERQLWTVVRACLENPTHGLANCVVGCNAALLKAAAAASSESSWPSCASIVSACFEQCVDLFGHAFRPQLTAVGLAAAAVADATVPSDSSTCEATRTMLRLLLWTINRHGVGRRPTSFLITQVFPSIAAVFCKVLGTATAEAVEDVIWAAVFPRDGRLADFLQVLPHLPTVHTTGLGTLSSSAADSSWLHGGPAGSSAHQVLLFRWAEKCVRSEMLVSGAAVHVFPMLLRGLSRAVGAIEIEAATRTQWQVDVCWRTLYALWSILKQRMKQALDDGESISVFVGGADLLLAEISSCNLYSIHRCGPSLDGAKRLLLDVFDVCQQHGSTNHALSTTSNIMKVDVSTIIPRLNVVMESILKAGSPESTTSVCESILRSFSSLVDVVTPISSLLQAAASCDHEPILLGSTPEPLPLVSSLKLLCNSCAEVATVAAVEVVLESLNRLIECGIGRLCGAVTCVSLADVVFSTARQVHKRHYSRLLQLLRILVQSRDHTQEENHPLFSAVFRLFSSVPKWHGKLSKLGNSLEVSSLLRSGVGHGGVLHDALVYVALRRFVYLSSKTLKKPSRGKFPCKIRKQSRSREKLHALSGDFVAQVGTSHVSDFSPLLLLCAPSVAAATSGEAQRLLAVTLMSRLRTWSVGITDILRSVPSLYQFVCSHIESELSLVARNVASVKPNGDVIANLVHLCTSISNMSPWCLKVKEAQIFFDLLHEIESVFQHRRTHESYYPSMKTIRCAQISLVRSRRGEIGLVTEGFLSRLCNELSCNETKLCSAQLLHRIFSETEGFCTEVLINRLKVDLVPTGCLEDEMSIFGCGHILDGLLCSHELHLPCINFCCKLLVLALERAGLKVFDANNPGWSFVLLQLLRACKVSQYVFPAVQQELLVTAALSFCKSKEVSDLSASIVEAFFSNGWKLSEYFNEAMGIACCSLLLASRAWITFSVNCCDGYSRVFEAIIRSVSPKMLPGLSGAFLHCLHSDETDVRSCAVLALGAMAKVCSVCRARGAVVQDLLPSIIAEVQIVLLSLTEGDISIICRGIGSLITSSVHIFISRKTIPLIVQLVSTVVHLRSSCSSGASAQFSLRCLCLELTDKLLRFRATECCGVVWGIAWVLRRHLEWITNASQQQGNDFTDSIRNWVRVVETAAAVVREEFSLCAASVLLDLLSTAECAKLSTMQKRELAMGAYRLLDLCDRPSLLRLSREASRVGRIILRSFDADFGSSGIKFSGA